MSHMRFGLALTGSILLSAAAASSQVVINELRYDAPGADNGQVFVELMGPAGTDISGWKIQSIEGFGSNAGKCNSGGNFTFPAGTTIPADGFFVLADDDGTGATQVANADIIANWDPENGSDAMALVDAGGIVLDAVAYGNVNTAAPAACVNPWFEGNPARDVFAPLSIERCPAGTDTGDNDTDFTPNVPTPGVGSARCGAIEFVTGTGPLVGGTPTLTVFNGHNVGLDIWMSGSAGQPYLFLISATGPATGTVPVVIDTLTAEVGNFPNVAPFIAWAGVLDGNGRLLGTASLDFSSFAGFTWPVPISTWIGAVSLAPGVGLVGTGITVQVDIN